MRLQPIDAKPAVEEPIQKKILTFLFAEIYAPLLQEIKQTHAQLFNSKSAINDAILSGRIQYADGVFKGKFSAEITKEFRNLGYHYDSRIKGFRGDLKNFPIEIQSAVGQTKSNYQQLTQRLVSKLDKLQPEELLEKISFTSDFETAIRSVDHQFKKTVEHKINVQANLLPAQKKFIAESYSDNMKLYVKDFAESEIKKLRAQVSKNVFTGYRAEYLTKIIKESYDVSDNKAKFLARQETNILTAKYKQTRYASAGITKYEWSTTPHGGKYGVRDSHKELNGTIHRFDDPPLISGTNRRCNPGEDFNCYCKAIPIFD